MKEISTRLLVKISLTVIAIFLVIHYWTGIAGFLGVLVSACVPLLLGLCLAYVLNILMSFYERHFFPNSRHRVLTKLRPGADMAAGDPTADAVPDATFDPGACRIRTISGLACRTGYPHRGFREWCRGMDWLS